MKIFILTEGGAGIGFGHITRCASLYQAFQVKGIAPEFIINGDTTIKVLLKDIKYKIFNWLEKEDRLLEAIKGSDVVIVDSYLAGLGIYRKISRITRIPVYIDDNKRIDYPNGIVLNGTIYARGLNYPKRQAVIYLLGPDFALLQKYFWSAPIKKIKTKVKSVLVTFGGEDVNNLTPKILKLLVDEHKDLNKIIIIGNGFSNNEEIENLKDKKTAFVYNPGAGQMKKIMLDSDIAVSAGGQTLHELLRVGVPVVAIAVAENQLNNVRTWQRRGVLEYAGWWKDQRLPEKILACFERLNEKASRLKRSLYGKKLIDGKGGIRVIQHLLSM